MGLPPFLQAVIDAWNQGPQDMESVKAARPYMKPGSYYWWETPANAQAERAAARAKLGLPTGGADIKLPADNKRAKRQALLSQLQGQD